MADVTGFNRYRRSMEAQKQAAAAVEIPESRVEIEPSKPEKPEKPKKTKKGE